MHICQLYTRILSTDSTSGGQFEANVSIPAEMFAQSGDKFGLVKAAIAMHLASNVFDTEVPTNMWYARFPINMQKAFNLPEVLHMQVNL